MLSFLPAPIVGAIAGLLFFINIIITGFMVVLVGLVKYLIPFKKGRDLFSIGQEKIAIFWVDINSAILSLPKIKWEVHGEGQLNKNHWYFLFANHQTWSDIIVLYKIFNHKIPFLKFFIKQELLWSLPMGGLACKMLGFPFMKRHSKAYLKKNPDKRNADIDTTRAACVIFKKNPTVIMNFLEGTRFTQQKQKDRSSPYKHLLRPKAGGLSFVVTELKGYIREVIDVTVVYMHKEPTFWNFISGKIPKIIVNYRVLPLSENLYGDYYNDPQYRREFQGWVNTLWQQKDALIEKTSSEEQNK